MRLTADEIRLIAILLAILVVGTAVKHYRSAHPRPIIAAPATPRPAPVEPAGY